MRITEAWQTESNLSDHIGQTRALSVGDVPAEIAVIGQYSLIRRRFTRLSGCFADHRRPGAITPGARTGHYGRS